jgi:hypothetical protein
LSFYDARNNNLNHDIVITIAGHEIDGIDKLYIDDCEVVFQSGTDGWSSYFLKPDGTHVDATNKLYFKVATGSETQAALADLVANNPKWTPQCHQYGCAHVYIQLVWDGLLYGDGLPDFQFLVRGKKVYDPRTATTYFSNLAALCAADWLMDTRLGSMKVPLADIDVANAPGGLYDAANICGETVSTLAGSEVRYAVNGAFDSDQGAGRILEQMAAAMGGHITNSNGLWKFWPAKWRAPTITLTLDDLTGPIRMQTMVSRDDTFNTIRGTYVSAAKGYIESDYPPVKNSTYILADGAITSTDIDFTLVTSSAQCQRLAKIELERIRQGIALELTTTLKAFQLQVPENVALTIARYGWTSKPFEVTRCNLVVIEGNGLNSVPTIGVSLSLRETASGVFDHANGEETQGDLAPNTNLPSPFSITSLSNLTLTAGTSELYQRGDGTIAPRIKVSWTALSDYFVTSGGKVEIQYRLSGATDYTNLADTPGSSTFAYISDVKDRVSYDVRARAVNAFKAESSWVTINGFYVEGKSTKPSNVTGFAAAVTDYGIALAWNAITDLDVAYYEVREGSSWDTALLIDQVRTTKLDIKTRVAGSHTFLIKSVDTSKNMAETEASVTAVISAPSISDATFYLERTDVIITFNGIPGSFAISEYIIRYGDTFGSSVLITDIKSTTFRKKVDWGGLRTFWVSPKDIAENEGSPVRVDVNVIIPTAVQFPRADVIRNNVLFKWSPPGSATLPIDHYLVLKGDVFSMSAEIGNVAGTFSAYFELEAGENTYWVLAVDSAGNLGIESPILAHVTAPQDFVLYTNEALDPSEATLVNIVIEGEVSSPFNEGGFFDIWSSARGGI